MQSAAWGRPSKGSAGEWSRRDFLRLAGTAAAGTAIAAVGGPALATSAPPQGFLSAGERGALSAATARIVPARGPGDWSAADLGAVDYIDNLLSGFDRDTATGAIYAGGPYRLPGGGGSGFSKFVPLSRIKAAGWRTQVERWRALYALGAARLDNSAGGSFAAAPEALQDLILEELDLSGDAFFAVLYDHTMEGTYAHPVYGGNRGYRAWQDFGFAGDVHGVRFPVTGSRGSWNQYGGFSPEEIVVAGSPATQQPIITPGPPQQW